MYSANGSTDLVAIEADVKSVPNRLRYVIGCVDKVFIVEHKSNPSLFCMLKDELKSVISVQFVIDTIMRFAKTFVELLEPYKFYVSNSDLYAKVSSDLSDNSLCRVGVYCLKTSAPSGMNMIFLPYTVADGDSQRELVRLLDSDFYADNLDVLVPFSSAALSSRTSSIYFDSLYERLTSFFDCLGRIIERLGIKETVSDNLESSGTIIFSECYQIRGDNSNEQQSQKD